MSESPVSDPEKQTYGADKKAYDVGETREYVADEGLGENTEFGEVKELRWRSCDRFMDDSNKSQTWAPSETHPNDRTRRDYWNGGFQLSLRSNRCSQLKGLFLSSGKAIGRGGPLGAL